MIPTTRLWALLALLALPMTKLAKALLIDHDPQMRWLNAFISNDPSDSNPHIDEGTDAQPALVTAEGELEPDAVAPPSAEVEQTLPFEDPIIPPTDERQTISPRAEDHHRTR